MVPEVVLPPLFEMDSFSSCMQDDDNLFCNVQATLDFPSNNKMLIDFMERVTANKQMFDRNIIHRGLCIAKNEIQNFTYLNNFSKKVVNQSLTPFTSTDVSNVEIISCTGKNLPLSLYDQIFLCCLISYFALIAYATLNEWKEGWKQELRKGETMPFIRKLSLQYNWNQRTKALKNEYFQNLLSMQGMRFMLMLGVVLFHVLLVYSLSFMSNPSHYEHILKYLYTPLFVFLVMPFFLFSSWLLTLQTYNLVEQYKEISLKNVGIIIINRYFRLAGTVTFSVLLQLSSWTTRIKGPLTFTALNLNTEACTKNWLHALLFTGNYFTALDVCHSVSWYLSADFQVYVINLLCLYLKFKWKLKDKVFYALLIVISCFLHGVCLYTQGQDIIFNVNIRHFEENVFRRTPDWVVYYTSSYSIWACSVIGLIFGDIYYKTKNKPLEKNAVLTLMWAICFISFPGIALLITTKVTHGRLEAAILGSIVKPIYNIGFAIGILGMSRNIGGPVKIFFENKYFVMLGNFTFCTYLVHMLPLIWLHSRYDWPWHISFNQIVLDYVFLSLLCWPIGILATLIIEDPGLTIQKVFLPQIKKKTIKESDKDNSVLHKTNGTVTKKIQ